MRSTVFAAIGFRALLVCQCFQLLAIVGGSARADIDLKFSGAISADFRFRVLGEERPPPTPTPTQWTLLNNGFSRNENRIRAAVNLKLGSKVRAVADAELMLFGFSDLKDIDSTTLRDRVDPYYFEAHAAFIDINNLLGDVIPRFDLRIGRQTVPWGAADKFNPISNINTLDLSDPLQFGRALANNMIRADWNPLGDLTFTAVLVPVFRPAQLPRSAPVALLDPLRPAPVDNQGIRQALDNDRAPYVPICDPSGRCSPSANTLAIEAAVLSPEVSASNLQIGLRAATKVLGQDVGLSYYRGRFGIPVPGWSVSTGSFAKNVTLTSLLYPRMDVLGVEMAGSIQRLGGLGYWIESAVIFPGEVSLALYEAITEPGKAKPLEYVRDEMSGQYFRVSRASGTEAPRPVVVQSTPFIKATLGADYTIAGRVYINMQYVHGFIDEFGAGRAARPRTSKNDRNEQPRVEARVGDYLVAGVDVRMLSDRLLMRLFGVIKLPSIDLTTQLWDDYRATGVLFPQISWTVADGTELSLGAFILLGDRSTKFGDPAAGASEIFARARVSF